MIEEKDINYARQIFSQYDYVSWLGQDKVDQLISLSIEHGKAKAESCKAVRNGSEDLVMNICEEEGITFDWEDTQSGDNNFVKFAQFEVKTKRITLNSHAIHTISDRNEVYPFETVRDVLIAHELYHYLEFTKWGCLYKQHTFTRKLFGLIPVRYSLLPMSEIAANAFAKELLDLTFNPYELNSLYFSSLKHK